MVVSDRQMGVDRVMTSGSPGGEMGSTLAENARDLCVCVKVYLFYPFILFHHLCGICIPRCFESVERGWKFRSPNPSPVN